MKTNKLSLPNSKYTLKQLEDLKNTYWDNNDLPSKAASSYWKIWQDKSFFNIYTQETVTISNNTYCFII